ncbi:MAG: hypothetical protein R3246_06830 [Acidimicrobiia bacterium]|nr:hypothetical protein [Acidimicrobiia bacterium]
MQRLVLGLTFVLLAAACSAKTAESTTTTELVAQPSTTEVANATTVLESTATVAEGPVDICRRGEVWQQGASYSAARCFLVPVRFSVSAAGFASEGAGDDWLTIRWRDPDDQDFLVRAGMITFESSEPPRAVLERIAAIDGLILIGEPLPVEVAGRSGLVVDFEGAPWQTGPEGADQCVTLTPVRFRGDGNPIVGNVGSRSESIGVGYCDLARVWVLEVDDRTVTIIGGTADPARHEEAVVKIEELFEGMTFEHGG